MLEEEPKENQESIQSNDINPVEPSDENKNPLWVEGNPEWLKMIGYLRERAERTSKGIKQCDDPEKKDRLLALADLYWAENMLFKSFGIYDLNNIERSGLSRLIKRFKGQEDFEDQIIEEVADTEEKMNLMRQSIESNVSEAVYHWLEKFCGVKAKDAPLKYVVIDLTANKTHTYTTFLSDAYTGKAKDWVHQTIESIEKLRHKAQPLAPECPYYFKEYLWKQRQQNKEPQPK